MERKKLTSEEIGERLRTTSGWELKDEALFKRFEFENFAGSLEFVNKIGAIAEAADHHPDICFGWGYAELKTVTHDRGGVTDVDFALVEKIDKI